MPLQLKTHQNFNILNEIDDYLTNLLIYIYPPDQLLQKAPCNRELKYTFYLYGKSFIRNCSLLCENSSFWGN